MSQAKDRSSASENTVSGWRGLYIVGGVAALATVLVGIIESSLQALAGVTTADLTVVDWFTLYTSNPFMGLRNLGLLNMGFSLFSVPAYLALLAAHRKAGRVWAALATVLAMFRLLKEKDCSLVEINPYVELAGGELLAADAQINFDDNGLSKHPELESYRNAEEYSPEEIEARQAGLSFVSLDGDIGCIVNGAGLAMATMDLIKLFGGQPANFLDVGGSSNPEKVLTALRILTRNEKLKAILINIFGGITRCDDIAKGILMAREQIDLPVPLVIRLIGTNQKEGREILEKAGLAAAEEMADAVQKVLAAARAGA